MAGNDNNVDSSDSALAFVIIIVATIVCIWFMTSYFSDEIRVVWRHFKIGELSAWQFISHPLNFVGFGPSPAELQAQIDFLKNPPGGNITPEAVVLLNNGWGNVWAKFLALYFVYQAIRLGTRGYRVNVNLYDKAGNALEPLLKIISKVNPDIQRYVTDNPADYPVYYRPYEDNRYAQRVTPWDFARFSIPPGLDTVEGNPHKDIGPIFSPEKPRGQRFNVAAAEAVFSWQMGKLTSGKTTFATMSDTEIKVYKFLKGRVFGGEKAAKVIVSKHAYIRTALMELFYHSTAIITQLQWVKYEDRTLYYCLQDVNLKVCSPECAGPWCHWIVERTNQQPIPIAVFDYSTKWMANLCDIGDEELLRYLKEDEMIREAPNYWEEQRNKAVEEHKRQEAAAEKPKRKFAKNIKNRKS